MDFFTIGYQGIDIQTFIKILKNNDINTVVDIREVAISRKRDFSKTALSQNLKEAEIDYIHKVTLGCPKNVRRRFKEDNDWSNYTHNFLIHLRDQTVALENLVSLTKQSKCVLMCFEADYAICHRSIVADVIQKKNKLKVTHLSLKDLKKDPVEKLEQEVVEGK